MIGYNIIQPQIILSAPDWTLYDWASFQPPMRNLILGGKCTKEIIHGHPKPTFLLGINHIWEGEKSSIFPWFWGPGGWFAIPANEVSQWRGRPPSSRRILRSSSSGIPLGLCSLGQAPLGTWRHAAAGIWEQSPKSTSSSSCEWPRTSRRSAAPSPWLSKHLGLCFVKGQVIQSAMSKKMTLTLNLEKCIQTRTILYCTKYTLPKKNTNTFNILQPVLSLARYDAKLAFFSLGHFAPRSCCHAAAGIWEQRLNFTSSSWCEWPRTSRRSAAPSPWLLKHLQVFCERSSHTVSNVQKNDIDPELGEIIQTR